MAQLVKVHTVLAENLGSVGGSQPFLTLVLGDHILLLTSTGTKFVDDT